MLRACVRAAEILQDRIELIRDDPGRFEAPDRDPDDLSLCAARWRRRGTASGRPPHSAQRSASSLTT